MTNVQERIPGAVAQADSLPQVAARQLRSGAPRAAMLRAGDIIRRTGPVFRLPLRSAPESGGLTAGTFGMPGIVAQLLGIVQQLLSMSGIGGAQRYFQSANASSTGDPHLAFDGTSAGGSREQAHFDSMTGHSDLLHSASFAGGYAISTSVTPAAANGVTYNQRATVTTNFGATQVSLDRDGDACLSQGGQTISLANGQSVVLGNGETVTRNSDGSIVIRDENGLGGAITTTLRENGAGVDVNAQASNVDLGGDLLNQPQPQIAPPPPIRMPELL